MKNREIGWMGSKTVIPVFIMSRQCLQPNIVTAQVPGDVTTPIEDDLPSVPSTSVPSSSKKVSPAKKVVEAEDSELAELAQWAS